MNTIKTYKYTSSYQAGLKSTPIPFGSYNLDWAFVIYKDGVEKLYFVLETKGTENEEFLCPEERAKIDFACKHFEAIGTDMNLSNRRKM
ncbi:hypothetical protein [Fervidibacillus albus]|uniref:Type III restriction enzyme C-terminal endonuclease domain-containing protein n=1 Tax=Fervidibacillus albus TaxID=2980026 RepID=A0A9E8LSS8_9BACI|nr:hypothetical protein [Fervidibacillus albus]WAA08935.1 hypothetical protein OE104_09990 [Fervidibacillus albus]